MTTGERVDLFNQATKESQMAIDDILMGKKPSISTHEEDLTLLTVAEACRMLNLKYPTFHRLQQAGCFDVVDATGKTMIRKTSVIEYAKGLRHPSAEYLAARAERNRQRREAKNTSTAQ